MLQVGQYAETVAEQDRFELSLPSCQPKLLSIRSFLPIRQLIAREVKQISVKLTLIVVARRSDMIKRLNGERDRDPMSSDGEGLCALHAPTYKMLIYKTWLVVCLSEYARHQK